MSDEDTSFVVKLRQGFLDAKKDDSVDYDAFCRYVSAYALARLYESHARSTSAAQMYRKQATHHLTQLEDLCND